MKWGNTILVSGARRRIKKMKEERIAREEYDY